MSANSDLGVPVCLYEIILEARATTETIQVLRQTRQTIYRIFIRIATAARTGTTTEPFTLRLGEIFLQPCESSLMRRDGLRDLLLRRLIRFIFEQECAREQ